MDQVRIFALGGLDENGKNMYVVEVNEAIFIIEAGFIRNRISWEWNSSYRISLI